jgi:5-methylcytosine-specific restriction protein A
MARAHNFTRKIIKQAKAQANGRCENRMCGAVLKVGEGEADHILPVEMGGESILINCQILCDVCHKAKTKKDIGSIRKSDRQRDKHTGAFQQAKRHTNLRARHKQNSATRPIDKWKAY